MEIDLCAVVWHSDTGDPTLSAWAMATVYVVAAGFCARVGSVTHQRTGQRLPWWIIAGILLFLGVNKLVAFQTVMFQLGRATAASQGWSEHRRTVQAVFAGLLAEILLITGCFACWKWRSLAKERPLVVVGVFLLVLLIMIRAANFTHVLELLQLDLHDDVWGWLLELAGAGCLAYAAARAARQRFIVLNVV